MRAVLLILNGRNAGRRHAVAGGVWNLDGALEHDAADFHNFPSFSLDVYGWSIRAEEGLRVNGRAVRQAILQDRDIIGYQGRMFRFHLLDLSGSPDVTSRKEPGVPRSNPPHSSEPPPSSQPTAPHVPQTVPRTPSGRSTVVTSPGRWGAVAGRWYDNAVFRISGMEEFPEELLGRLHCRIRCHLVLGDQDSVESGFDPRIGNVRLRPFGSLDPGDMTLIRQLWQNRRLIALMSPLESELLVEHVKRVGPLLDRPEALAPLLRLPERSLLETLREADAALLFGSPDGWEIFCCPEMMPVWRRIGLPAGPQGAPLWNFETIECRSGLIRCRSSEETVRPSGVAAALAKRNSLYLLVHAADADLLPERVPVMPVRESEAGQFLLITPAADEVRFALIDSLWERGVVALVSGRSDRDVVRFLGREAHWRSGPASLARHLAEHSDRHGLGGFEAVLLDAGDGAWSVFADPRPIPVWRRYGLPSPVIDH